jgi:mannitol/fructose-specific phosphotransferase system IIA component (Ntr-type)
MSTLSELLPVHQVDIALHATTKADAVDQILARLAGNSCVKDFAALKAAIQIRDASVIFEDGLGLLIAHGRTEAVSRIVLAAGRCSPPLLIPEAEGMVQLVFVAGIPAAFSTEYLRVVGAIVRCCKDPEGLPALLDAPSATDFVQRLGEGESRL